MPQLKIGEGPGYFIADVNDKNLTSEEIRKRWKAGEYGTGKMALRPDLAKAYWRDAGRD